MKNKIEKNFINELVGQQFILINTVKDLYPEMKIRLSIEELRIVNEVIYENIYDNSKHEIFCECMEQYILNVLFDVINENEKKILDFKLLIDNWKYLVDYVPLTKVTILSDKMNEKHSQEIGCKIISFKRRK